MNETNKKNIKILVVDDEQGIRNLLGNELKLQSYTVLTAKDGEEAIKIVKQEDIQLVISDIMMPKMNGLEVLRIVKKISPETEVIMITGYATVENAVQAMKEGAYDFVQKPFVLQELFALIERALEKVELKVLVAIYESSQAVFSTLKLEELLPLMIKLLKDLLKADEIALLLFDHQSQLYLAASSFPLTNYAAKEFYLSLSEKLNYSGKFSKSPVIINVASDKEFISESSKADLDVQSLVVCPITLKGRKYGVLCVARKKEHVEFLNQDLRNLSIFSSQMAQSIANTKLYEQLEIKVSELETINNQLEETRTQLISTQKLVETNKASSEINKEVKDSLSKVLNNVNIIMKDDKTPREIKKNISKLKDSIISCQEKLDA